LPTSARVRVDAAKAILDRAGYTAAAPVEVRDSTDITMMSRDELQSFIFKGEARINARPRM
jgi:hypothetical protein